MIFLYTRQDPLVKVEGSCTLCIFDCAILFRVALSDLILQGAVTGFFHIHIYSGCNNQGFQLSEAAMG